MNNGYEGIIGAAEGNSGSLHRSLDGSLQKPILAQTASNKIGGEGSGKGSASFGLAAPQYPVGASRRSRYSGFGFLNSPGFSRGLIILIEDIGIMGKITADVCLTSLAMPLRS